MRRVPYTTYRPVYRTETYRVPVTTISNDCNSCNTCGVSAGTCSTCNTGLPIANGQTVPGGTINTGGNYSLQNGGALPPGTTVTELPADTTPSLNPQNSNRSVIESLQNSDGSSTRIPMQQSNQNNWALTSTTPTTESFNRDWSSVPVTSVAAKSPVTKRFAYTAIKQVNYVTADDATPKAKTVRGKFSPVKSAVTPVAEKPETEKVVNQGWETVQW
jgi:hypothetical protein